MIPLRRARAPLRGRRILIVEDEAIVSMLIEDTVGALGGEIVGPATRVARALALARDERIDAAILDVNLAGEPIYPVADALSARGIPFVFLTGYRLLGLREEYHARPIIQKPFATDELEHALARVLGG